MKCTLDSNINNCPFYKIKTSECNNEKECSFKEKDKSNKTGEYVREERWYEKYYRKKN